MHKKIKLNKFLAITALLLLIIPVSLLRVKLVKSETKTYQSADVAQIGSDIIATVTNGSGLETLLITRGNKIKKLAEAVPNSSGARTENVLTRQEGEKTIAYVAAGPILQKYDISRPAWPVLMESIDSPVGYARDVSAKPKTNLLIIAGDKGAKELETNTLTTIRDIWNATTYGIDISPDGKTVLNTYNKAVVLNRNNVAKYLANLKHAGPISKKPYITPAGTGFAADENGVKKVGTDITFTSPSGFGYSLDADYAGYIYFVNGWGVYKLDKNLNQINFQTINLIGGWARGVKVFTNQNGYTRILVLATDRIYLLSAGLEILDIYSYQPMRNLKNIEIDDNPAELKIASKASPAGQPLRVRVSKAPVVSGDHIKIYATGYYSGEPLALELGKNLNSPRADGTIILNTENLIAKTVADGNGNVVFEHIIIPEQKSYPTMINARVYGKYSKKHYTSAIRVNAPKPEEPEEVKIETLETHQELIKEIERNKEITEETQGNKTIVHEIVYIIEKLVKRQIAEIEIRNSQIEIQRGEIKKNTYVRWINKDRAKHTIKSIKTPDANESFDSEQLRQDQKYQFKFEVPGTYKYTIDGKKDVIYEIIVK